MHAARVNDYQSRSIVCNYTAPDSPPQDVRLTPVSSTSIRLSWSPPPTSDQNGVITEYRITITEVVTGRVIRLTSTTTSITALNLHPFYAYQCIVSAFTIGLGPYSQVFNITTPEDGMIWIIFFRYYFEQLSSSPYPPHTPPHPTPTPSPHPHTITPPHHHSSSSHYSSAQCQSS